MTLDNKYDTTIETKKKNILLPKLILPQMSTWSKFVYVGLKKVEQVILWKEQKEFFSSQILFIIPFDFSCFVYYSLPLQLVFK